MSVWKRIAKNWHWIFLSVIFWYCGLQCIPAGFLDTGGDSAQYIIIGESLSQGKGLRMMNYPGEPFSGLAPGISVFLSGILFFFGRNFWLMHALMLLFSYLSLIIFYKLFKEDLPHSAAFLLVVFLFLSRLYWWYSQKILTEAPLLFFSGISFLAAIRYKRKPSVINKEGWITAAALLLTYFFRYVGILVFLSVLVYLWIEKEAPEGKIDKKKIVFLAVVFVPFFFVWQLRNAFLSNPYAPSFAQQFFPIDGYVPHLGYITDNPWFLVLRFVEGVDFYASIMQEALMPFIAHGPFYNAAVLILFLIVWLGLWNRHNNGRKVYVVYFLAYFVLISFWPFYEDGRYIYPLLPFIFYFFFFGLTSIFQFFTARPQKALKLLHLLLAVQLVFILWFLSPATYLRLWTLITEHPPAKNFLDMNAWIPAHVTDTGAIISRKPTVTYLYTGHQAVVYPFSQNPDTIWQAVLKYNIKYIIVDEAFHSTGTYLKQFLVKYEDQFTPVHRIGNTMLLKRKG
ncbi:MAG: glycosyltransferase family 39 protein [Candidatus Omnitrophota bacterium]|jgi:hypothetical protein